MNKDILIESINKNLKAIKSKRPLTKTELKELQKSLGVFFTYHSNAIEGNSISLGETKLILEDGISIGGKTIRELQETLNHKELLEFLYSFLEKDEEISEDLIKKIHSIIMKNIDENAGEYRKIQVYISGEEKLPPKAENIEKMMKKLIKSYKENNEDIIKKAIKFHYDFVKIHPFIDGNGRSIRLILNMILMKAGFPMIIIPLIRRAEYIQTLNSKSNFTDFEILMLDIINQNLEDYLRMIEF
ncbi:Fic family protein [Candidatus Gracilibacteria bacterium]|nr:MAG: Fic family protein [Candidatus Gracilibacteria bacterium]